MTHTTMSFITKTRPAGQRWFFIAADCAFGCIIASKGASVATSLSGEVVGSAAYPFPSTTDFSVYLLQAQAVGATVIAFANAGQDLTNFVKQTVKFGLARPGSGQIQTLAALSGYLSDIVSVGPAVAQELVLTEAFYWDLSDRTGAFTKWVRPAMAPETAIASNHAGMYSGLVHYLKVARQMGVVKAKRSGRATVVTMKQMPTDDDCFGPGHVRSDGLTIHPSYLFRVKSPERSRGDDLLKLVLIVPTEQTFRPENQGGCPMVSR